MLHQRVDDVTDGRSSRARVGTRGAVVATDVLHRRRVARALDRCASAHRSEDARGAAVRGVDANGLRGVPSTERHVACIAVDAGKIRRGVTIDAAAVDGRRHAEVRRRIRRTGELRQASDAHERVRARQRAEARRVDRTDDVGECQLAVARRAAASHVARGGAHVGYRTGHIAAAARGVVIAGRDPHAQRRYQQS